MASPATTLSGATPTRREIPTDLWRPCPSRPPSCSPLGAFSVSLVGGFAACRHARSSPRPRSPLQPPGVAHHYNPNDFQPDQRGLTPALVLRRERWLCH